MNPMDVGELDQIEIRTFVIADTDAVVALWSEAGIVRQWNDPRRDIERKLSTQPELFLVAASDDLIVATAMVGYDGHRGWIYYLAVAKSHRGRGIARSLMAEAERLLIQLGCPKLMLMVRSDNESVLDFYDVLGYSREATVVLGKRLIGDEA